MTIPTPDQMFPSDFPKLTVANSVTVLGDDGTKSGYVNVGELISQALTTGSGSAFNNAMASWWGSLPTTLPTTAGKPWNDGGVLSWT